MLVQALAYARSQHEQHLQKLYEWLRIPSVSTLPEHAGDVRLAAQWAVDYLHWLGLENVAIVETGGHPAVTASWTAPGAVDGAEGAEGENPTTLLLYGHFDVQPPDPLDEWRTPPFEPSQVGDDLYCRGASDDKGQLFAVLAALGSYLKTSGRLPVNVKLLLEGEEEIQSRHLKSLLSDRRQALQSDAVLVCDQDIFSPQHPTVLYGVRGTLHMEIEVRGPGHDLHSGTFGGLVDNPFNVLAGLLAALKDSRTRRVLVPGFYEAVRPLSDQERSLINQAPVSEAIGLHLTGALALAGEEGYSLAERISVRPTLEVHGIIGGFTGQGTKSVIPAKATAKISLRLVPDQDPEQIAGLVDTYLHQLAPPSVSVETRLLGSAMPVVVDFSHPAVRMAGEAYRRSFQAEPIYFRGGGSLAIVHEMISILSDPIKGEIPIVMIGFGLPDGNTHAPNEKLHLPTFYKGIETVIHYLWLMGGGE